ncbi:retrovirus-related pol polyprotein from transposon TNT 1-94 [Tanacetum coccineum]
MYNNHLGLKPNYVCKLDKALYGLKQAPIAWYETLSKFLIQHKFVRGTIDNTLFTYKTKSDVIIVQMYVDDIIFGSTSDKLSKQFAKLMTKKYPKETPNLGLWYLKGSCFNLKAYSDSDYTGCNLDRKSASGACQVLGGKLVCWSAKKQSSVAMLSTEVPIFCDNTSAIVISNNLVLHARTKHIDIRYHFIRDRISKGDIELHFVPTDKKLTDIFTKPLAEPSFTRLVAELGMLNIEKEVPDEKKDLSDSLT